MAKVYAGTYSRPTGKAGGVVWGAARSRTGKVATTREYSIPANPESDAQVEQRMRFQGAVLLAKNLPNALYSSAWNNTLGLLPGWQSLVSYLTDNLLYTSPDPVAHFPSGALATKSLGPCYNPGIGVTHPTANQLDLNWSTALLGDHCAATDGLQVHHLHDRPHSTGRRPVDRQLSDRHDT